MTELDENASILIILMGSVGDVVRGLAVASALRKRLPRARISWLVEPKCEVLVRMHEGIDEVLLFDRNDPVRGIVKVWKMLHQRHFDVTLDMQRHFKSGLFSLFSGAARRIGFHKKNAKEGNWLFNNETIPFFSDGLNKFFHYFKFVEQLGLQDVEPDPCLWDWARRVPELCLPAKRCVGLVLKSSWESKDWPEGYFGELLEKVLRAGDAGVVLLGDAASIEIAARVAAFGSVERVRNLAGRISLEEMIGVMRQLRVCVGPDSGPGHIAAAVRTPYIALFGPTSAERTAPVGQDMEVLCVNAACSPCYKRICPGLGQICMTALKPDMVLEKLLRYLED